MASITAARAASISSASGGMRDVLGASTSKDGDGRLLEERYLSTLAVFVAMIEANSEIVVVVMAVNVWRQSDGFKQQNQ